MYTVTLSKAKHMRPLAECTHDRRTGDPVSLAECTPRLAYCPDCTPALYAIEAKHGAGPSTPLTDRLAERRAERAGA